MVGSVPFPAARFRLSTGRPLPSFLPPHTTIASLPDHAPAARHCPPPAPVHDGRHPRRQLLAPPSHRPTATCGWMWRCPSGRPTAGGARPPSSRGFPSSPLRPHRRRSSPPRSTAASPNSAAAAAADEPLVYEDWAGAIEACLIVLRQLAQLPRAVHVGNRDLPVYYRLAASLPPDADAAAADNAIHGYFHAAVDTDVLITRFAAADGRFAAVTAAAPAFRGSRVRRTPPPRSAVPLPVNTPAPGTAHVDDGAPGCVLTARARPRVWVRIGYGYKSVAHA